MCLYYYIYKYDVFYSMQDFFETFPLVMWIDPCHGIARPYLVRENYILFVVKTWVVYFSIEMRKYVCFCELCIDTNGLGVDHCMNDAYVKQWKYVPLNPKGPYPISTWQEMHTNEAVVSLDHDQVSDLVKKGTW